jgi:hypothetical protein
MLVRFHPRSPFDPLFHARIFCPVRLFHVAAAYLPKKILVSQHRTIHLLMSACAKGSATGGMSHYLNHAGFLAAMHHDCVKELLLRGGTHSSPVFDDWRRVVPVRRRVALHIPPARIALDVMDLSAKIRSTPGLQDARLPIKFASASLASVLVGVSSIPETWIHE